MDEEFLKNEKARSFRKGLLTGTLFTGVILCVVGGFLFKSLKDQTVQALENVGATYTVSTSDDDKLINQAVATKAEKIYQKILDEFYFTDDIDEEEMRDSIYSGIIDSLGDKYAVYYNKEDYEDLFEESEGVYYGIGSYVSTDETTGYPKLTGVFDGSPAKAAGLRDGDIIVEVDGESISGLTLTEAVNKIKGPENTDVTLTIYREGESDYLHITVTRGRVESPTVVYSMKENDIGYLQITEFDDITSSQFEAAYKDLNDQGMKAMILDLRSNGGGNLDTVLEIAEQLLPEGIITYTEDKYGNREEYRCKGENEIQIPLVVLTNGYTASASELLSGAIRDYGKGTLIGTNTYGKGIVQTIFPLGDGTGIKFTTSSYFTPSGECIHGYGIAPDIELEFDSDLYYSDEAIDNQLEYAINYLTEQLNK